MADPTIDNILEKRAAFATNFIGTTNLAQRRRYQEDIVAAKDASAAADEAQFSRANQRAELADPLKARAIRNQEYKSLQDLSIREKQLALQEQRFSLEEKKADYALKKSLREQATAERMLADTDAVEQADFDARNNGWMPGSPEYAKHVVPKVIQHGFINPSFRKSVLEQAGVHDDPEEIAKKFTARGKTPVITATINANGETGYTVREAPDAKVSSAGSLAAARAKAAQESSRANLDESTRVWQEYAHQEGADAKEVSRLEKEVQKRQADMRAADARFKNLSPMMETGNDSGGPPAAPVPPKIGEVRDGYKFNGGKLSDPSNWSKVE